MFTPKLSPRSLAAISLLIVTAAIAASANWSSRLGLFSVHDAVTQPDSISAPASAAFLGACANNVTVTATAGTASASYATLKDTFDAINAGTHQGSISVGICANTTE